MMKVLLAMDPSSASQTALEEVLARPWPAGSSLEVISVVDPSHPLAASEAAQSARCAEEVVQNAVMRLQATDRNASGFVLPGDPKTVIPDRANSASVDLIVVGSHGASALKRFLLGSVAGAVLRYAGCSVEVVRARADRADRRNLRVLLATDGSEYSWRAAHSIADRPWPAGTEIRVLSAVEMILPTTRVFLEPPFVESGFMETARAEAMQRAQDAVMQSRQILASAGLEVSESISVLLDQPKVIILDEATAWGADLIVLGSHGRHRVERFLLGSVSEAVAMHAACSVEVVRRNS